VRLSLILGDNTLGRLYMLHQFTNVFTLSDIWKINNDRVKYFVSIVKIDYEHPRKSTFGIGWINKWSVLKKTDVLS